MIPRALVALALLCAVSCSPTEPTGVGCLTDYRAITNSLGGSRARWARVGPSSYTFRFERGCFCPEDIRGPFLVRVEGGLVRSATTLSGAPASAQAMALILSVPQVFDLIDQAIDRRACSVRADYDAALGFPTAVDIDYDARLADEEVYLRLSELTAR